MGSYPENMEYAPYIFNKNTMDAAKSLIVGSVTHLSMSDKWELETDWLAPYLEFGDGLVIDYGCGVGRLAKLIKQPVLGVDISPDMRTLALDYVSRYDFDAVNPVTFMLLVKSGMRAHGALAVWSLQHIPNPSMEIEILAKALVGGSKLLVVNNADERFVPVRYVQTDAYAWINDGVDIDPMLNAHFSLQSETLIPQSIVGDSSDYLRIYIRR